MTRSQGAVTLGSERHATSGRSPLRQDLSEGLCVGLTDFTERPQAMQYVVCIQCPVKALCPSRTPQPQDGTCCKWGHMLDAANRTLTGACRTCLRDRHRGRRTPPNVTLEALAGIPAGESDDAEDLLAYVRTMRGISTPWATICTDLGVPAEALAAQLRKAGADRLAASIPAQDRESGMVRAQRQFVARVEQLRAADLDSTEIAAELGYARVSSLRVRLRRLGRSDLWDGPSTITLNRRGVYVELAEQGLTMDQIAVQLGVKVKSVETALYRAHRPDLAKRARVTQVQRGNQYGRWSA